MLPQKYGKLGVVSSPVLAGRPAMGQWSNLIREITTAAQTAYPSPVPLAPAPAPGALPALPPPPPSVPTPVPAGCKVPMTSAKTCPSGSTLYMSRARGPQSSRICVKN